MKAEIFNYKTWTNFTDPDTLKPMLEEMLTKAGFKILKMMEHRFKPFGYTAIWLLEESHLAVHTFPEEDKSYIELSSCNEEKNKLFIIQLDKRNKLSIHT